MSTSRLVNLTLFQIKSRLKMTSALSEMYAEEPGAPRYDSGNIRTRFTPRARFSSMNLDKKWLRDGLRITKLCLGKMVEQCKKNDTRLVLLFLQTKEYCYYRFLDKLGKAPEALAEVSQAELRLERELKTTAREHGIETVNPTPDFLAALRADQPVWPQIADGHFNAHGYALVANAVKKALPGLTKR